MATSTDERPKDPLDKHIHLEDLDDDIYDLFQLPAVPTHLPQLPEIPSQLPKLPEVPTPVAGTQKSFRLKVREVFTRRNSVSGGEKLRGPPSRHRSEVHASAPSTPTTTTLIVPVIDTTLTTSDTSSFMADSPPSDFIPSGLDVCLEEDGNVLPSKWFGQLPKHFVMSLLELLSPANILVLSDVDHCLNDVIKEHQDLLFLPEKNTKLMTPTLTWRHIYTAKHRKNMKSCNIVFCGAPQTGTKSSLIRAMAGFLSRRLFEMHKDKGATESATSKSKNKKNKKDADKDLSIFRNIQDEETEEDRIQQELQKFYTTSFLMSASFYYGLANGNIVKLNCYELGTEEYMVEAATQQLRNSNAIVFGFDVTSSDSFSYFDYIVPKMKQIVQPWCVLLLVANKCDLDQSTWCSYGSNEKSELTKFASKFGIEKYFFTSARHGTGVDPFVDYLAYAVGVKREPIWMPDNSVDECKQCSMEFRLLKRKHHCRHCGCVFCNDCTIEKMEIREMNLNKPVRVCGECRELLQENQKRREQPLWSLLDLS